MGKQRHLLWQSYAVYLSPLSLLLLRYQKRPRYAAVKRCQLGLGGGSDLCQMAVRYLPSRFCPPWKRTSVDVVCEKLVFEASGALHRRKSSLGHDNIG
jgi:hypothetical protein